MAKSKFVLNRKGVGDLLKSAEMGSVLREYAEGIRGRAGDGYELIERTYGTRKVAAIRPESDEAIRDNLENNTLLKAVR